MATYPSILAWRIPWTEEPGRLESQGCKELDSSNLAHTAHLHFNPGFCSFTQGVSSYLRLFQRPKSWRIPRRQQSRWDSQPSSFRSVKTASWVGGPLIWYCNNSSCWRFPVVLGLQRFPAVGLSVQLGSCFPEPRRHRSLPAVHTRPPPQVTRGCREIQDGSGLLRVRPGWSDSKTKGSVFCTSPTSNFQSQMKSGGPPVIFGSWGGFWTFIYCTPM